LAGAPTLRTGFRTNRLHLQWLHVALRQTAVLISCSRISRTAREG
jgi:hypothetical protein